MKKLIVLLILVAFIASMMFVGIGCKEEAAPSEEVVEEEEAVVEVAEEATEEEVVEEAKPYEGETLTIWYWEDDNPATQELFDEFTKKTGIILNWVWLPPLSRQNIN